MKKLLFRILLLLCTLQLSFFIPCSNAQNDDYMPAWEVGLSWNVSVQYRGDTKEETWSPPVLWRYSVDGIETVSDDPAYRVTITSLDVRYDLRTVLWYRCNDLSLKRVKIFKKRNGREIEDELVYKDMTPVVTTKTLTPFDAPVFQQETGTNRTYFEEKKIGTDLVYRMEMIQKIDYEEGPPGVTGSQSGDRMLRIGCADNKGRMLFTQFYKTGKPWPVSGRNQNMKYELVEK